MKISMQSEYCSPWMSVQELCTHLQSCIPTTGQQDFMNTPSTGFLFPERGKKEEGYFHSFTKETAPFLLIPDQQSLTQDTIWGMHQHDINTGIEATQIKCIV